MALHPARDRTGELPSKTVSTRVLWTILAALFALVIALMTALLVVEVNDTDQAQGRGDLGRACQAWNDFNTEQARNPTNATESYAAALEMAAAAQGTVIEADTAAFAAELADGASDTNTLILHAQRIDTECRTL